MESFSSSLLIGNFFLNMYMVMHVVLSWLLRVNEARLLSQRIQHMVVGGAIACCITSYTLELDFCNFMSK